jgi:hypothetical protein
MLNSTHVSLWSGVMCQADKMNSRFEGHCAYFRYIEKNIPVRIKTDILYGL